MRQPARLAGIRLLAAIDLFTCALDKDLLPLIQLIRDAFGATHSTFRKLDRDAGTGRRRMSITFASPQLLETA